jgi:hypothetical protein
MDERPDKIMSHIESERNRLGQNLNELETRVRDTTDWRTQFNRHPYVGIGIALGGGLLLGSAMLGSSHRPRSSSREITPSPGEDWSPQPEYTRRQPYSASSIGTSSSSAFDAQKHKGWSTFDNIKGALFALAATKAKDYLDEILPGFREHYDETGRQTSSGASGSRSQSHEPGFQRRAYESEFSGSGSQNTPT